MTFLLDTNALLFWLAGSERLGPAVRAALVDKGNSVYVSAVSAFEISVKASLGRLTLPEPPAKLLPPFIARSGLTTLPVSIEHAFGVYDLPFYHNDPFDRLLIAQAISEGLTLVTSDRVFGLYAVKLELLD